MRFLVGVMHCIENEFSECKKKILGQVECEVEFFVIENLPNKIAHAQLYDRFKRCAEEFDCFVKVDADMVINSEKFFSHIAHCFSFWPMATHLEFPVFDHFTMKKIYGLHAWQRSHSWEIRDNENLFTDRANGDEIKVRLGLETPAVADHCPNPSSFQAYHFGVHKAIKVTQPGRHLDFQQAVNHWQNFRSLESVFVRKFSIQTALPVLGFLDAVSNGWNVKHVDFDCNQTNDRCKHLESLELSELVRLIESSYGLYSRRWLPGKLRMFLAQEYRSGRSFVDKIRNLKRLLYTKI